MASTPGSSSRPHGHQEGDWQSCSVPHLQQSRLQTQGYLPLADLLSVQAGLASIDNDVMAENFPNPNREESVLCPIPAAGPRISNPSLSQGVIGVLWHRTTQPHPRFDFAHLRLLSPSASYFWVLRPILNYGGSSSVSFPATEKVLYLRWAVPKYGV